MNAYELADKLDTAPDYEAEENGLHIKISTMLRQQAALIEYYKIRDDSYQKTIAELEKEVKELQKIAQVMAMQESDARKSLQNYKDGIK